MSLPIFDFVSKTADGGFARAGYLNTSTLLYPDGKVYLAKYDSFGNTKWCKVYDSLYDYAVTRQVMESSDMGFLVVGTAGDNDSMTTNNDVFLLKTDDTGKMLWGKLYGGIGIENGISVQETYDGGFIVLGNSNSTLYLIKTDNVGNITWTKTFVSLSGSLPLGKFIKQTDDNGYIIAGEAPIGIFPPDLWLMKTDSTGTFLWSKIYGGNYAEKLFTFDVTSDGGFILGGYSESFTTTHNYNDGILLKTDRDGNGIWTKIYNKPSYSITIYSAIETKDSGFLMSMTADTFNVDVNIELVRTDDNGLPKWSRRIGPTNLPAAGKIIKETNGGILIAGILGSYSQTAPMYYTVQTDSLGNTGCFTDTFSLTVRDTVPNVSPITLSFSGTLDSSSSFTSSTVSYYSTDSTLCFSTGIQSLTASPKGSISVFPNPTTGIVAIKAPFAIELVEITNAFGELVFSAQPQSPNATINLQSLPKGIYFYSVKTKYRTDRGKIVLQ